MTNAPQLTHTYMPMLAHMTTTVKPVVASNWKTTSPPRYVSVELDIAKSVHNSVVRSFMIPFHASCIGLITRNIFSPTRSVM